MLNANNINKPLVIMVSGGYSGCRAFRADFPANAINWVEGINLHCIVTPVPLFDAQVLSLTRAVVLKSINGLPGLDLVKQYKAAQQKFGFRLLADYDDQPIATEKGFGLEWKPWGPQEHKDEDDKPWLEIARLLDGIIVTNEFMARELNKITKTDNYYVIPNCVPRSLFSAPQRRREKDLDHPIIVGTGCPLHSLGPHKNEKGEDVPGNPGDWASAEWTDWLVKNIKDKKIDYVQMGGNNWLLDKEVPGMYRALPWVPPMRYPSLISRLNADFVVAPLVECEFNKFKSDLRLIESQVCSSVLLGSVFPDSPYSNAHEMSKVALGTTAKELDERLRTLCDRDEFNKVVEFGWKNLVENGRIMESDMAIDRYVKVFTEAKGQIAFDLI